MMDNNEYDALGEMFRLKLETHQIEVDSEGWDEIERRLGNRSKKTAKTWLWRFGAIAAAAAVAALLFFKDSKIPEFQDSKISEFQDSKIQEFQDSKIQEFQEPIAQSFNDSIIQSFSYSVTNDSIIQLFSYSITNDSIIQLFSYSVTNDSIIQSFSYSITNDSIIQLFSYSIIEEEEEEEEDSKQRKWLLAAAFGIGGYTSGIDFLDDTPAQNTIYSDIGKSSINNSYAVELSNNIVSFENMTKDNFNNISHSPPFSFGMMARKSLAENAGVEIGLAYTYLASRFEWSNYNVNQNLHYLGIPVNLIGYMGSSKSNWRFYFSGGFTVEKGLRAIYRQETNWGNAIRTTTVKSSIDGLQWSLNGGLGVNRRLEKGFGVYLEPRVGYSFKNNQPISIRTEWPVYVGVNFGLNYEL